MASELVITRGRIQVQSLDSLADGCWQFVSSEQRRGDAEGNHMQESSEEEWRSKNRAVQTRAPFRSLFEEICEYRRPEHAGDAHERTVSSLQLSLFVNAHALGHQTLDGR